MPDPVVVDLAHLPLDIHLAILHYLEPSEIIALRLTCKNLWDASKQRAIWLEAIEKMCADNTLYRYSFPIDEMSDIDLEYASLAPAKWEFFARRDNPSEQSESTEFQPSSRTFTLPHSVEGEGNERYMYLVPGGRFLLLSQDECLMLWDLGYVGESACTEGDIKLLAQTTLDCFSITTHPSPDGLSIRLLIDKLSSDYLTLQFDMLEIDPHDSNPTFVTIATHRTTFPHHLSFTSVCGDMVAFLFGPIVQIWDVMKQKCISWNTSRVPLQILFTPRFVVLVHDLNCTVWEIPEPSQWTDSKSHHHLVISNSPEPLKILPYSHELGRSVVDCYGLCDWYTGSTQPLWFDIQRPRGQPDIHRFIADLDHTSSENFCVRPMPSYQIVAPTNSIDPYRVCGNHLVAPWRTSKGYRCHSMGVQPTADQPDNVLDLFRWDGSDDAPQAFSYSLCPVAGRLVVASRKSDRVQVIDLLRERSEQ